MGIDMRHMKLTDVIRRPLITEKTTLMRENDRTIVFEVAPGATKVDVKRAVEKLLGSKVEAVRTAVAHGKMKRQGRFVGQRSDWKKAYVKLGKGEDSGVPGRRVVSCKFQRPTGFELGVGICTEHYMPIRSYKPTSSGRRFQTVQVFDEITRRSRTSRWSSRCESPAGATTMAS